MTTYQLNFNIDDAGLQKINNAGQYLTIVKSATGSKPAHGDPVAWLAFAPMGTDLVSWTENDYLYSTQTLIESGATIIMSSTTPQPLQEGSLYTFNSNYTFATTPNGSKGVFDLNNQAQDLVFGLAQKAVVNQVSTLSPLNAISVLYGEQASFEPEETLSIFLSSYDNNGCVISQVASNALVVTLTSVNPTANIGFDDANNVFVQNDAKLTSRQDFAARVASRRVENVARRA